MNRVDIAARYPTLTEWMNGAKLEHPFADALSRPAELGSDELETLDEVETVIAGLHAAAPQRLAGKRRDFRRVKSDGLHAIKAELVFAARLARSGIKFDFGAPGTPQPDLVLRDLDLGVEITTRTADAQSDLRDYLTDATREERRHVILTLRFSARPLAIRSNVKEQIAQEVRRAAAAGEREVQCVVRPAAKGNDAIAAKITIRPSSQARLWPRVRLIRSGVLLTPMMSDVEDGLVATMVDKRKKRQGQAMPTVLIVDLSGVSGAWLRPMRRWGDKLVELIEPDHEFVALAIMASSGWATDFKLALGESPHATAEDIGKLRIVEQALGLRQIKARTASRPG